MAKKVVSPYVPRTFQQYLHDNATRFTTVVCHRRFGKTVWALNHMIMKALKCQHKNPQYLYISPTMRQTIQNVWSYVKEYTGFIPGVQISESTKEIRIPIKNDSTILIRMAGAEDPMALKGTYYDGVVFDEVAQMPRIAWSEAIRPTLADREGWAVFIGTPQGKNFFKELYEYPGTTNDPFKEWSSFKFKASETGILSEKELESCKAAQGEDKYRQEYECDFHAATPGTYYAAILNDLRKSGNIGDFEWNPDYPVVTAWDLGSNDKTTIWFAQMIKDKIYIVDYYENNRLGTDFYANIVKSKPYVYDYHILPHDSVQEHDGVGSSKRTKLTKLGLKCEVLKRSDVEQGIIAVQNALPICRFHEKTTSIGLDALSYYHSEYDSKNDVQRLSPVHDWSSHAADSFRYLVAKVRTKRTMSTKVETSYDYFGGLGNGGNSYDSFDPLS